MLGADPQTLFFGVSQSVPEPSYTIQWETLSGADWSSPTSAITSPTISINTGYVTPDGLSLVYNTTANDDGSTHNVINDIERSAVGDPFGSPNEITELSSDFDQTNAVLSADKLTIYFASNRASGGNSADYDIFVATRAKANGKFGTPTAVQGGEVNNGGSAEQASWISADQCTLYFSSDRTNPGVGRSIYKGTRTRP